jgi:hypothetical protein
MIKKLRVGEHVRLRYGETWFQTERLTGSDMVSKDVSFVVTDEHIGVVGAVDVPCVYKRPGCPWTFLCIDYNGGDIDPRLEGHKVRIRPYLQYLLRAKVPALI